MGESAGLGAGGLASGMGLPGSSGIPALGSPQLGMGGGLGGALQSGMGGGLGGALPGGGGMNAGLGGLGMSPASGLQLQAMLQQPGMLQALLAARGQGAS